MGLDMSHDAWSGAYGAFSRYRNEVAAVAGYDIARVTYPDGFSADLVLIDWGHLPGDWVNGNWGDHSPDDALLYLIAHSDCEGYLEPEACARLADRLEELLPKIEAIPTEAFGHIRSYGQKTRQLIDGLRNAADAGERLEFW